MVVGSVLVRMFDIGYPRGETLLHVRLLEKRFGQPRLRRRCFWDHRTR